MLRLVHWGIRSSSHHQSLRFLMACNSRAKRSPALVLLPNAQKKRVSEGGARDLARVQGAPCDITKGFAQQFLSAETLQCWANVEYYCRSYYAIMHCYSILHNMGLEALLMTIIDTSTSTSQVQSNGKAAQMDAEMLGSFFCALQRDFFSFFSRAESLSCPVCWINIDLPFAIKQMTDQEIGWRLKMFQADSDWLSLLPKYRWRIDLRCCRRWILKT